MKFDNVIIGGGLAGLLCGIRLQRHGKECLIVSNGQSAMDFSSGSFDLLSFFPKKDAISVIKNISQELPLFINEHPQHPYAKLGLQAVERQIHYFLNEMLEQLPLELTYNKKQDNNHLRITPLGSLRPAWLSPSSLPTLNFSENFAYKKLLVLGINGYNDFQPELAAENLSKQPQFSESNIRFSHIHIPDLDHLRKNMREFRSINISQALEHKLNFEALVTEIKEAANGAEAIFLPACFGLDDSQFLRQLEQACEIPLFELPTLPPSLFGIRQHRALEKAFQEAGGMIVKGDRALRATLNEGKVSALYTRLNEELALTADNYILASGSFLSNGLIADFDKIYEPVFNLDLIQDSARSNWTNARFEDSQPYLTYGCQIDATCHASKNQQQISNLYAIGNVVGGYDAIQQGCGSGVAIVTALYVAEQILQQGDSK